MPKIIGNNSKKSLFCIIFFINFAVSIMRDKNNAGVSHPM